MSRIPIDVVILAGGQGTRLRKVIGEHQKVVAPVNGKPFLLTILNKLYEQGFRRVILALGYQSGEVVSIIESAKLPEQLKIIYSIEDKPLGTGGALRNAYDKIDSDEVLILNGDTVCDVDFQDFHQFYINKKADIAIAVSDGSSREDVGNIQIDQDYKIQNFSEKEKSKLGNQYMSLGRYFINKFIISSIPQDQSWSLEHDLFPLVNKYRMYAYRSNSKSLDIGTEERLSFASEYLSETQI